MEVRGPLCGVGSLPPPLQRLGVKLRSPGLWDHLLCPLRHLHSSLYVFETGFHFSPGGPGTPSTLSTVISKVLRLQVGLSYPTEVLICVANISYILDAI